MRKCVMIMLCAVCVTNGFTQTAYYKYFFDPNATIHTDTFDLKYNSTFDYVDYMNIDSVVVTRPKIKSRNSTSFKETVFSNAILPVNCKATVLKETDDGYGNTIQQISLKNITSEVFGYDYKYNLTTQTVFQPFSDCPFDPTLKNTFPDSIKRFLLPTTDIQSTDATISALAQQISKGCVTLADIVEAAILWNKKNLTYDFTFNYDRQDAVSVLQYKTAICEGYSNFTCAVLRSLGIAARRVDGRINKTGIIEFTWDGVKKKFPQTEGGHSWIEVYYPSINQWVASEPQQYANLITADYVAEINNSEESFLSYTVRSQFNQKGTCVNSFNSETSDTLYSRNLSIVRHEPKPLTSGSFSPYFCLDVTVKQGCSSSSDLPDVAEAISGTYNICESTLGAVYTVPAIARADSYVWTLPDGSIRTTTINSVTIDIIGFPQSGILKVKGHNSYGDGLESSLPIWVLALPSAFVIQGPSELCIGQGTAVYTINNNGSTPSWTVFAGATATGTATTLTLALQANISSGNLKVHGSNSCGNGPVTTFPVSIVTKTSKPIIKDTTLIMCDNSSIVPQFIVTNPVGTVTWIQNDAKTTADTLIPVKPVTDVTSTLFVTQKANGCTQSDTAKAVLNVFKKPAVPEILSGSLTGCCYVPFLSLRNVNSNDSIQWFLNGNAFKPQNVNFTPQSVGKYSVIVIDSLGCFSQTSNVVTITELAVPEISKQSITLSPNPTNGNVMVAGESLTVATVEVYSWLGVLLETKQRLNEKLSIDLSKYPAGIYNIVVRNGQGRWTGSVIKE